MARGVVNRSGEPVEPESLRELADNLVGRLLFPEGDGYDEARSPWNASIDRRPALIARCEGTADVADCVRFATRHGLDLAVLGSGRGVAGNVLVDGGLVIDLREMRAITVDPQARRVRAEGGCTWGELDRATQAHGLATPGGVVSTTGIAGLTLGGGVGWLVRRRGLTCDWLRSIELVAADGRRVSASQDEHPELFWACRGGGGNFGVVTALEYELHEQGPVLGGELVHPRAAAGDLLRFHQELMADAPWELTAHVELFCAPAGEPLVTVRLCYCGDPDEGEREVKPLRDFGSPLEDRVAARPYLEMQKLLDPSFPSGRHHHWYSRYLPDEPGDEVFAVLLEHAGRATSPLTTVGVEIYGGRASLPDSDATAFPHRARRCNLIVRAQWTAEGDSDRQVAWTRDLANAIEPYTAGAYYNYLHDDGEAGVREALDPNLDRLRDVKRRWDPDNLFRSNQNIEP